MRVFSVLHDSLGLSFEAVFFWIRQSLPEPGVHILLARLEVNKSQKFSIELGLVVDAQNWVTDAENWGYGCTELGFQMQTTGVTDAQNWGYGCTELGFKMHIQLVQMLRSELGCSWFQSKHFNCWASLQPAVSVFKLVFHCVSTIVLNWTV